MQYKSPSEEKFLNLLSKPNKTKGELEELQIAGEKFSKELQEETNYLLEEIKNNGLIINNIYDLVNTNKSYSEAIEPLRKHLSAKYHIKNKEGIIRALGVKESGMKEIKALIDEYDKFQTDNYKFCIALSVHNILKHYKVSELRNMNDDNNPIVDEIITNKKLSFKKFDKFLRNLLKE